MEMEKVDVLEIMAYSWEYPYCGSFYITGMYNDLICENCMKKFEVGKVIV